MKNEGDKALIEYTQLFDKVKLDNLVVSYDELKEAASLVDDKFYQALEEAKKNIEDYHKKQKQNDYIFFKRNHI